MSASTKHKYVKLLTFFVIKVPQIHRKLKINLKNKYIQNAQQPHYSWALHLD